MSLTSIRTISSFLQVEQSYTISFDYFKTNQHAFDASMRSTLTTWMLEVCEEEACTNQVFALSVNLLDRVICVLSDRIEKRHLQLIGIVCLFIASKLKSVESAAPHLDAAKLIDYTAHTFTLGELLEWEMFIMHTLKWDVAAICPNDYLEIFLSLESTNVNLTNEKMQLLHKHAYAFTALCATDYRFAFYPPSMIASACFLTALDGVVPSFELTSGISEYLAALIHTEVDFLQIVKELVKSLFKTNKSTQTEMSEKVYFSIHQEKKSLNESSLNPTKSKFSDQFKRRSSRRSGRMRG